MRKRILELLPTMTKIKAGPVEAEFDLAARQVLVTASEVSEHSEGASVLNGEVAETSGKKFVDELLSARSDPAGMILEGWGKVDGELFKLGLQEEMFEDPLENTGKVFNAVMSSRVLPAATASLIHDLRELRNKVAHARVTPSSESAQDYLVAVDRVVELIRNYRKNLPNYGPANR